MRGGLPLLSRRSPSLLAAIATICALGAVTSFAADATDKQRSQIVAKPAAGFSIPSARPATLTERLLSDARDGRLDDITFLSAALIASGAETTEETQKWLAMYEPVRAGIVAKLPAGTATDRLTAI